MIRRVWRLVTFPYRVWDFYCGEIRDDQDCGCALPTFNPLLVW